MFDEFVPVEWADIIDDVPSPCYVIDLDKLEANARLLHGIRKETNCEILLALKGFAMFSTFSVLRPYLSGACASSVDEARLAREEFGGEVHAYAPAYSDTDIANLIPLVDHITFNSVGQWNRFYPKLANSGRPIQAGMRINPEHSEVEVDLYNPCAPGSRLGEHAENMDLSRLQGMSGIHFHNLCEKNADALERTLAAVERRFRLFLGSPRITWVNFGGGHHITRDDYDIGFLKSLVTGFQSRYDVRVYLEPGEAVALNCGYLVSTVLDTVTNNKEIAILDTSAAAHMPDVIEMPYRPDVIGMLDDTPPGNGVPVTLGGLSCLAGDVIGDYHFSQTPRIGDRLIFTDMAHYTMVKSTTFNGVKLPSQALWRPSTGEFHVVREFDYGDYRGRLS